ncbi:hypothetical protein SAMN05880574_11572 [Chryseobacterium sp. RU37D]|nr:hypothetical protein SAMN05880574_11572 [Chryseobacterium sp. RU37D]
MMILNINNTYSIYIYHILDFYEVVVIRNDIQNFYFYNYI